MLRSRRIAILLTLLVLLLAAGALVLHQLPRAGAPSATAAVTIGGPFELVRGDGRTVTDKDFAGKMLVVFFGYTHCPDICPTTLNTVALALDELAPAERDQVQGLFITVDPERDTPEVMQNYVASFEAPILGLSGSPQQIQDVVRAYRVYAAKHQEEGSSDYTMDHSTFVYVMDRKGLYAGHVGFDAPPEELAKKIEELMS